MTEPEATPETPTPKPAGMVDLSDLRMMPAWVAGMSAPGNLNKYEEREERGPRREGGRDRRDGDRRGGPPPRRDGGGYGGGPGGGGPQGRGDFRPRRDGPPGQGGGPRRDDRGGPRRFGDRDRGQDRPQREWVEIPKDIKVLIEPEDKSAEALANHIRSSGHAFSMFDAARLVLAEGDRFHVRFSCAPERATGLFVTPADGGLFMSREEALTHVLRSPAIESYYKVEEIELEEPKGDFKTIGVCGMTGELLGPPSHHSYQATLLRLHRERFANMPLEDYKRRVRTEANPELVTQWKESQRKGQRWVYVKDQVEGAEPVVFSSRAEMESHFRRTHGEDAAIEGREVVVPGSQEKGKITHILGIMLRNAAEGARKHLFEMSQKIGGGFERRGLKLFKRRAGKLFVCRVKPRAIDPGVVFSERVSKIVEILKATPGMHLSKLVEAIVPSAVPAEEGEAKPQLTDEQISVLKDLRWLTNEGYVIEYSDGMVFLGVQGEQQPKAKATPTEKPAEESEDASDEATAKEEASPAEESSTEPTGEESAPATEPEVAAVEETSASAESPVETTAEESPVKEPEAEKAPETPAEESAAVVEEEPVTVKYEAPLIPKTEAVIEPATETEEIVPPVAPELPAAEPAPAEPEAPKAE
ncbi:MAG: hypothetical protein OJI67_12020 [Prosthecobacter sp.]|nr:hypothetical protein [Prosthecobacter sp.]